MLLYVLTLVVTAAIVLALAGYLTAIAWALTRARKNVKGLADGLEVIAGHTAPLDEKIGQIAGAVGRLVDGFGEVDAHLAGTAEAFKR